MVKREVYVSSLEMKSKCFVVYRVFNVIIVITIKENIIQRIKKQ